MSPEQPPEARSLAPMAHDVRKARCRESTMPGRQDHRRGPDGTMPGRARHNGEVPELTDEDRTFLLDLVSRHADETGSTVAASSGASV